MPGLGLETVQSGTTTILRHIALQARDFRRGIMKVTTTTICGTDIPILKEEHPVAYRHEPVPA
jgi:hypothetical protein